MYMYMYVCMYVCMLTKVFRDKKVRYYMYLKFVEYIALLYKGNVLVSTCVGGEIIMSMV